MTYSPNGGSIGVNIQIEVPAVDLLPIIRITGAQAISFDDFPDNAEVYLEETGFTYSLSNKPDESVFDEPAGRTRSVKAGAQAENSPFTQDEAVSFALKILNPYVNQAGSFDLKLKSVGTLSRAYKVTKRSMRGDTFDFSKPKTEMGLYDIYFEQIFHGVPFIKQDSLFDKTVISEPGDEYMGYVSASVASNEDYGIGFYPVIEDSILAEDVPLAPFSKVKAEFERLIELGYIRDVYRVRLGYLRLNDPMHLGEKFILIPVWELNGVIVKDPKSPTPTPYYDDEEEQKLHGGLTAYVNAQTGEYYDYYNDISPTRKEAAFLTWNEVK